MTEPFSAKRAEARPRGDEQCSSANGSARPFKASARAPATRGPEDLLTDRGWRVGHSIWILGPIVGLAWASFLYIGIRARRKDWIAAGVGYFVAMAIWTNLTDPATTTWVDYVMLTVWIVGVVHALLSRRSWLRWRAHHAAPWYARPRPTSDTGDDGRRAHRFRPGPPPQVALDPFPPSSFPTSASQPPEAPSGVAEQAETPQQRTTVAEGEEDLRQARHDVFVSYSTRDKPVADAIVARLEQAGIRCWIAPRDVLPGKVFAEAIVDAIDTSRLMVVVLSGESNQSHHVHREVERAFSHDVIVIPLRIESIEPSGAMAYYLASEHWLDAMTPPLESHIAQLVKVAHALLVSTPTTHKEPPAPAPPAPSRSARLRASRKLITGVIAATLVAIIAAVIAVLAFSSATRSRPATPEELDRALLTPPDLQHLSGLEGVAPRDRGSQTGDAQSGIVFTNTEFVSGDAGCRNALVTYPIGGQSQAYIFTKNPEVGEGIESFASQTEAQQVMLEARDRLANCHTFVAKMGKKQYTFVCREISIPKLGNESVSHQLSGDAEDGSWIVRNIVEIRSGLDMIFISYTPSQRGIGHTAEIATTAMAKYSTVR